MVAHKVRTCSFVSGADFKLWPAELLNLDAVIVVRIGQPCHGPDGMQDHLGITQIGVFRQNEVEIKSAQGVHVCLAVCQFIALRANHLVRNLADPVSNQGHITGFIQFNPPHPAF